MATFNYLDLDDAPISLRMTIGEMKILIRVLRSLPEDHEDRYFARLRAREFTDMVKNSGNSMSNWAENYQNFGKQDD